jgi:RNA polymerase sigma-70 factor (ECF subfamily)
MAQLAHASLIENDEAIPSRGAGPSLIELWNIAFRVARTQGVPTADAEDVASLTVVDFVECKATILQPSAWIFLVARRKAWALRRKQAVRSRLLEEYGHELVSSGERGHNSVETMLDLRAALCALDQESRQAVLERHLLGEPLEKVARTAGLSVETVKRRLKRGRETVQRSLEGRSVRSSFRFAEFPSTQSA